ncbi:MAG: hypothetical protein O2907_02955 [Proteobacteria bacterium]|nr:hypothetical protein [Pseudomonadota bacterium]
MANDKKNINELVTDDDDSTAEMEAIVLQASESDVELESASHTVGFHHGENIDPDGYSDISALRFDLRERAETINRLEFEVAKLDARRLGLEAETGSRDEANSQLRTELESATTSLTRKQELIKNRDQQIKSLRLEIRERNEQFLSLQQHLKDMGESLTAQDSDPAAAGDPPMALQSGPASSNGADVREFQQRYIRTESYADQLRQQLQDRDADARSNNNSRDLLQHDLLQANDRIAAQTLIISDLNAQNATLSATLAALHTAHAEEIRMVRFELGEAQSTLSQHELLTEQLASDLVETRTYRIELENMLNSNEESNKSRIEKLEQENRKLRREASESRQKLETKKVAINCLISELAKKSNRLDVTEDMQGMVVESDNRNSDRGDHHGRADRDKITRVLIGSIDDQEVRFPLFKDRLTIGRRNRTTFN